MKRSGQERDCRHMPNGLDGAIRVERYAGPRSSLRGLFRLAEDSADALEDYLEAGQGLVGRGGEQIVGHLQLTETGRRGEVEIKNMAVVEQRQGQGIGRRLVEAAQAQSRTRLVVATAAADIGNLRFYQRLGFRMSSVERDAFTPE